MIADTVYSQNDNGTTQVIIEGPSHSLRNYWDHYGVSWSGPGQVGGNGTAYSAPVAVVMLPTGFTQVLVQGPGNNLDDYWDNYGIPWIGPAVVAGAGTAYSAP